MPDPKLKTAAADIKAVLKKHDVAGLVLLASTTHCEFLYELTPSWSCVKEEDGSIRVQALRKNFGSDEEHRKVLTDTVSMFMGLDTQLDRAKEGLAQIIGMLGRQFDISHRDWRE